MEGTLKMQPAVLKAVLLLVVLGLVTRSEAQATNCNTVAPALNVCASVLGAVDVTVGIGSPSAQCCTGLADLVQLSSDIGANVTCECIRSLLPGLLPANLLNISALILAGISGQCPGSILGIFNPTLNILPVVQCML